jgi:hypothetical protein
MSMMARSRRVSLVASGFVIAIGLDETFIGRCEKFSKYDMLNF